VQARATMICAIAMVLPATVYANEVSLPEIGVTLTGLAGNANKASSISNSALMVRVMCLKLRRPLRYLGGWATARHRNCETEFSGSLRIGCRLGRTSYDSP